MATITAYEVKDILKSLPLGYYSAFRMPIEGECAGKAETSYYSPAENKIVIACAVIAKTVNEANVSDPEPVVRAHLYHELSHVLATPDVDKSKWNDLMNVAEDARIETIYSNYYKNVNFAENIRILNGLPATGDLNLPINNAWEAFYYAFRFGYGQNAHVRMAVDIISDFIGISKNRMMGCWNYFYDRVIDFYKFLCKEFNEEFKIPQNHQNGINGNGSSALGGQEEATNNSNIVNTNFSNVVTTYNKSNGTQISNTIQNNNSTIISNANTGKADPRFMDALAQIIESNQKRNGGAGSISAYSGVINPRNIVRDDCRYFDHKLSGGQNKYGSVNLNLFIDESGSFSDNDDEVNTILHSIYQVAKNHPNFTYTIYKCGQGNRKVINPERYIHRSQTNTHVGDNATVVVRDAQKPSTYNYNIVLYDGAANDGENYVAYNRSNCTMILDRSCKKDAEMYCQKARKIYVNNYTASLKDNILKALRNAFR